MVSNISNFLSLNKIYDDHTPIVPIEFLIIGRTFSLLGCCLGFIGNLFALITFVSLNEFKKISTGLLLLLLTLSNFIHLSTLTIESLAIYDYRLTSNMYFQCHLNPFVKSVSRGLSTYLSVGVAIDRLIRSEFPMRSRVLCTRRNVYILTLTLLMIFVSLWSVYFVPSHSEYSRSGRCIYSSSDPSTFFLVNVNSCLRAALMCIIPVILMSGANIRMLRNIRQSQLRIADAIRIVNDSTNVVITGPVCRRVSAMDRMLMYMMICNILTFIVTQIPFHLYTIVELYDDLFDDETDTLVYGMILIWSSIYFGIAFYLYCLTSPLFRRKFIDLSKKIFVSTCMQPIKT